MSDWVRRYWPLYLVSLLIGVGAGLRWGSPEHWLRWPWDQIDRLSDWVGPHLATRTEELTLLAVATVALLVVVHCSLLFIMGYQRPWTRLQRAIFWFVAAKGAFWAYLLYQQIRTVQRDGLVATYPFRFVLLVVAMAVSSLWLIWEIDRRYRRAIDE